MVPFLMDKRADTWQKKKVQEPSLINEKNLNLSEMEM